MDRRPMIRGLFAVAGLYDGLLGLAFVVAGPPLFSRLGIAPPNHWGYVHFAALPPLFFDLERDPRELEDLASDPACQALVLDYARKLLSWRMRSEDRTLTRYHLGPGGVLDRPGRWSLA